MRFRRTDLSLSAALFPDRRGYHLAASGISRSGTLQPHVFEDVNGDLRRPLPGVEVALVDAAGKRFAVTRSDFEGLAYFDGVPVGQWRLEAAHAAPVPVTLSRETLLVSDAHIIVGR